MYSYLYNTLYNVEYLTEKYISITTSTMLLQLISIIYIGKSSIYKYMYIQYITRIISIISFKKFSIFLTYFLNNFSSFSKVFFKYLKHF